MLQKQFEQKLMTVVAAIASKITPPNASPSPKRVDKTSVVLES